MAMTNRYVASGRRGDMFVIYISNEEPDRFGIRPYVMECETLFYFSDLPKLIETFEKVANYHHCKTCTCKEESYDWTCPDYHHHELLPSEVRSLLNGLRWENNWWKEAVPKPPDDVAPTYDHVENKTVTRIQAFRNWLTREGNSDD